MVEAHRRDGAALCSAFAQLERMVNSGELVLLSWHISSACVVWQVAFVLPGLLESGDTQL